MTSHQMPQIGPYFVAVLFLNVAPSYFTFQDVGTLEV